MILLIDKLIILFKVEQLEKDRDYWFRKYNECDKKHFDTEIEWYRYVKI